METTLHRTLKRQYGPDSGGRSEVAVGGYRIDAVDAAGTLIEVQSGALGPLRGKLNELLPFHRIRVVKPLAIRRRVIHRDRADGRERSARLSPKRNEFFDVFQDLVGVVSIFPHPNLTIDVVGMTIEEIRVRTKRRPGYIVADRRVGTVEKSIALSVSDDLWKLLPPDWDWSERFTTKDLARRLERPRFFAQQIAYCLRCAGASALAGKSRNSLVYVRAVNRSAHRSGLVASPQLSSVTV